MTKKKAADQLFRIITVLNNHFAAEDVSPTDADRWRELKCHIIRMKNALELITVTLHEPLTADTARSLQDYVRRGLGEPSGN